MYRPSLWTFYSSLTRKYCPLELLHTRVHSLVPILWYLAWVWAQVKWTLCSNTTLPSQGKIRVQVSVQPHPLQSFPVGQWSATTGRSQSPTSVTLYLLQVCLRSTAEVYCIRQSRANGAASKDRCLWCWLCWLGMWLFLLLVFPPFLLLLLFLLFLFLLLLFLLLLFLLLLFLLIFLLILLVFLLPLIFSLPLFSFPPSPSPTLSSFSSSSSPSPLSPSPPHHCSSPSSSTPSMRSLVTMLLQCWGRQRGSGEKWQTWRIRRSAWLMMVCWMT